MKTAQEKRMNGAQYKGGEVDSAVTCSNIFVIYLAWLQHSWNTHSSLSLSLGLSQRLCFFFLQEEIGIVPT